MNGELTLRQKEILDFIAMSISGVGYPPSITEIQKKFSFKSPNAAKDHLLALERKGYIKRQPHKSRSISLTDGIYNVKRGEKNDIGKFLVKEKIKTRKKMVWQKYPEPTVGALIFNRENKIFLMKSHKWKNKYTMPGGHIELGETIEDALKREIKEETGLDIYDIKFIGFQEFIYNDSHWKKRHFIFLDFSCKTDSEKVKLNSEAQEYIWVSPKEALKLPVENYTRHAIEECVG